MLEWWDTKEKDVLKLKTTKNKLLDKIKTHKPERSHVYDYIAYLPDYLPAKGPVRKFLKEMSK